MKFHVLAGSAILSSVFVTSSVIGSAIARPFGAEDAAASPTGLVTSTISSPAATPSANPASGSTATGADLVAQLLTAGSAVERYKLLTPADFAYDFNNPPAGAMVKGMGTCGIKPSQAVWRCPC
jgi:hypothetical protein